MIGVSRVYLGRPTLGLAHLPSHCLAFAAIRIQPLLKNPETAEVLGNPDGSAPGLSPSNPLVSACAVSAIIPIKVKASTFISQPSRRPWRMQP